MQHKVPSLGSVVRPERFRNGIQVQEAYKLSSLAAGNDKDALLGYTLLDTLECYGKHASVIAHRQELTR